MVSLLARIFIKDSEDISNPKIRRAYGMLCSIVGIMLNVFLFVGKYAAGVISGSIAITADAFNNLSDAGSSFVTLVGFKMAGKKADATHPFGHGRIEYISGLVVSIAIILMGFELLKTSVDKLLHPVNVKSDTLAIIILIISICVKIYMFAYNTMVGKKISSGAMKATALDSLSDSVATTVVLISMLVLYFAHVNIDGIGGIAVALFILWTGCNSAKDTLSPLLGQAPDEEFVRSVEKIVLEHKEILGVHDLIVHDYGPGRIFVSLHGEVNGDDDIYMIHDVIDNIEHELFEELSCEAVIHMDPIAVNDELVSRTKEIVVSLVKEIDSRFTIHDFRMVAGPSHTNLIFDVVTPYENVKTDKEIENDIVTAIKGRWDNYYPVIKIDKAYAKK